MELGKPKLAKSSIPNTTDTVIHVPYKCLSCKTTHTLEIHKELVVQMFDMLEKK